MRLRRREPIGERTLKYAAAAADVPVYVVQLHMGECSCPAEAKAVSVFGPFVTPDPWRLLGWAQRQCDAPAIARMLRPTQADRAAAGAR